VHFEFKNYLAYGFEFLIEYDDGDTLETTPDVLNNVFDTTPWTHAYSSPKVYEVHTLTVKLVRCCVLNAELT
jgi:hypothetical protein